MAAGQEFLNHIGGVWSAAESKNTLKKFNPFTGEELGLVSSSDAMDVIKALAPAKKAQAAFEKTSLEERASLLEKIARALAEKSSEYALQEALHQGLPANFTREKSVDVSVQFFRAAAAACRSSGEGALPVGLIGIVASWCLSLRLICERLAPALAAGNACLIKVSELSPVTANILVEVLEKAGVPAGLVQFIHGTGSQVGALLAAHPSIRAVSFVGKIAHADSVIKAASAQFKKIQIATGAKNSALVLNETSYRDLMPAILESFLIGQGQLCWNTHRLFLPESLAPEFLEVMKESLSGLQPLESPQGHSPWTPLIEADRVEKVLEKSQAARQEHAKIIFGAEKIDHSGFYLRPTFTLDLTNCSVLQQDEVGGPLFIVTPVKYQHEMIKWSNTGYYGHSAVIWGPEEKAVKAAATLQCSQVWIHSWLKGSASIAGQKQSSFGNMDMRPFGSFFSDVKKVTLG